MSRRLMHDFQRDELVKLARSQGPWSAGTAVLVVSVGQAMIRVRPMGGDPFEVHYRDLVRPRSREPKPTSRFAA